jgi:uncharacterized membrane protein YbhN (UPF0104 family)
MKNPFKNMTKKTKRTIKRTLMYAFYVCLIIFLILYFKDIDFTLITNINMRWGWLIASFSVRMVGLLILPISWKIQLGRYNQPLSMGKLYTIYAQSWLGRYIPGKVAWVGGKIFFAKQENINTHTAVVTSFLDSILQVFCTMLVAAMGFLLVGGATGINVTTLYLMYGLTLGVAVLLLPPIFNRLVAWVFKLFKKKELDKSFSIDFGTMGKSVGIVTIAKVFSGVSGALIMYAINPEMTLPVFLYAVAAASMAAAVGMAAIFAPAGIGVKEGLQLVLLSNIMPKEIALVGVTLVSVMAALGDIVFYLVAKSILHFDLKSNLAKIPLKEKEY